MLLNSLVKSFNPSRSPSLFGGTSGAFERELDRFFRHPFFGGSSGVSSATPAIDVHVSEKDVVVTAELPGIDRENLDISLEQGYLTIKAVRHSEKSEGEGANLRSERHYGSMSRSVKLPVAVSEKKASALYEDGVLRITLPRSDEDRPRKIKVS